MRNTNIHVTIPIIRLKNAIDLPLPTYQSDGAAGMDLYAVVDDGTSISPGKLLIVPCGISLAIPAGFEGQVRSRSGLVANHGVCVANAPGTIDSDYRGEVTVLLINHGTSSFMVERGMRIAQLIVSPVMSVEWTESIELQPTTRDTGGFGHTGL